MRARMNNDIFEGKWKQIRGQAKGWWAELTDDDLEKVGGKFEQLLGLLRKNMDTPANRPKKNTKGGPHGTVPGRINDPT